MGATRPRLHGNARPGTTLAAILLALAAVATARHGSAADLPDNLATLSPGTLTSAIPTLSDPTQTWELYLPQGFTASRKWPVLILFDPRSRGRLAAELFQPAADELGWILASSNNTRSDGPGEPNARAIKAMIPDVMKRLPVDPRRIYAGGFSGGGVLAWILGLKGGFLAGVISIGGRPAPEYLSLVPKFALFAAAGEADFNYQPTRELDRLAAKAGVPHRLEFYPGPHSWCPAELARTAVTWLEILAMRDGLAPVDRERVARTLAAELAAAEALAGTGDALASGRKFQSVAETFRGIGDDAAVQRAARRAAELLSSTAAKSSVKEEKKAEEYESQGFRRIGEAAGLLRSAENPIARGELRHLLGVDETLRRRDAGGIAGAAAKRRLAAIQVHLGFYLTNEFFAADDYRRAVPGLDLVSDLFPEDAFALYNLACAQARSGAPDAALAALEKALAHGLKQPLQMETDADLASLRGRPEFARLLERARRGPG